VHSKFSCVRSSHDLCAHTHAHSLEGTLVTIENNVCVPMIAGYSTRVQRDSKWTARGRKVFAICVKNKVKDTCI